MSSNLVSSFILLEILFLKFSSANRFAREYSCVLQDKMPQYQVQAQDFKDKYLDKFQEKPEASYNIPNRFEMQTRFQFKTPCGTMEYDPAAAIIEGKGAPDKAWPWQTRYFYRDSCGGALLDANWVLTAAHCVENTTLRYMIRFGSRMKWFGTTYTERNPKLIVLHEKFNTRKLSNDIALIKLDEPVNFTDRVRPVCLPVYGQDFFQNDFCYLTGFGDSDFGSEDALNQLKVYVLPHKECYYLWRATSMRDIEWNQLCAGRVRQRGGMCFGDSGGPLSCKIGNRYYLAGIASFGPPDCNSRVVPDVFQEVTKHINWIFHTMSLYP